MASPSSSPRRKVWASASRDDVDLDDQGNVVLSGKGMSVVPGWRDLLAHRIPIRLKPKFPGAAGHPDVYCFAMGDGPFSDGPVTDDLELQVDTPTHGAITPRQLVPLDRYQSDLASTREAWTIDEN